MNAETTLQELLESTFADHVRHLYVASMIRELRDPTIYSEGDDRDWADGVIEFLEEYL